MNSWADDDGNFFNFLDDGPDGNYGEGFTLDDIKPYLRPLSSMTEKEKEKLFQLMGCGTDVKRIDFYISHYFDYRGLIPMGLALEAKEGMYNTK